MDWRQGIQGPVSGEDGTDEDVKMTATSPDGDVQDWAPDAKSDGALAGTDDSGIDEDAPMVRADSSESTHGIATPTVDSNEPTTTAASATPTARRRRSPSPENSPQKRRRKSGGTLASQVRELDFSEHPIIDVANALRKYLTPETTDLLLLAVDDYVLRNEIRRLQAGYEGRQPAANIPLIARAVGAVRCLLRCGMLAFVQAILFFASCMLYFMPDFFTSVVRPSIADLAFRYHTSWWTILTVIGGLALWQLGIPSLWYFVGRLWIWLT